VRVTITKQSAFDLINRADKEGEPYVFVRLAPCNEATAIRHLTLHSTELKLYIHISLSGNEDPRFVLDVG
jgi:hypothetical protein